MKKILLYSTLLLSGCNNCHPDAHSDIYLITTSGMGQKIGEVSFTDTPKGLLVNVDLHNLPSGEHGFIFTKIQTVVQMLMPKVFCNPH